MPRDRVVIKFGRWAPSLHDQLAEQGVKRIPWEHVKLMQEMLQCIWVLAEYGMLTENEVRWARKRVLKQVCPDRVILIAEPAGRTEQDVLEEKRRGHE